MLIVNGALNVPAFALQNTGEQASTSSPDGTTNAIFCAVSRIIKGRPFGVGFECVCSTPTRKEHPYD